LTGGKKGGKRPIEKRTTLLTEQGENITETALIRGRVTQVAREVGTGENGGKGLQ